MEMKMAIASKKHFTPSAETFGESNSRETSCLLCGVPDDVLCNIMSFSDPGMLCNLRCLNQKFKRSASQNSSGWDRLCLDLWDTKIHVCREAQSVFERSISLRYAIRRYKNPNEGDNHLFKGDDGDMNIPSAMSAYRMSVLDAEKRDHVTREELLYDPDTGKGTVWSFRFKEAAGTDWTSFDPWHNNQACRKVVFLRDGSVKAYTPRVRVRQSKIPRIGEFEDTTAATIQRRRYLSPKLVFEPVDELASSSSSSSTSGSSINSSSSDDAILQDPEGGPMTWRFVTQPLDFPDLPLGSYIRFSVRGREVPTYVCRRSPTNNWGFVMESCWGVYASFELPPKVKDGTFNIMRRRRRRRLRRALNLGREVHFEVEVDVSSDEEDEPQDDPTGDDVLVYDDCFNVTTELQWREAFLYNNFALPALPEGIGALLEFKNTYGV
eukprot:CAMPEP_0201241772 /NCGR_PEP_ID=MMETSP0852-20130820/35187_1 /ASSEMBLY_ACC=CAM_ASM_000632 /TAXON_ID=183588 /ORGANISM="Pseudo-nitzschia fraudulenta, Strain WWA7" /LENGTH=436 /DNA_ID=CAMNT_0047538155 /DNA_START=138 /DNA_END=1448 /DNA_ORIENTATION=+